MSVIVKEEVENPNYVDYYCIAEISIWKRMLRWNRKIYCVKLILQRKKGRVKLNTC